MKMNSRSLRKIRDESMETITKCLNEWNATL